jgi:myo-inositol-1(or 4)-monophosphatase
MTTATDALGIAVRAAHAAGRIIQEAQGGHLRVRHKGVVDLVTQIDEACEAEIRGILEKDSPGVPVLAEEGGGAWGHTSRWLVDPLDGTTNFVHGYLSYGVSIALELDGALVAGCIFDPIASRTYTAVSGGGAHCDSAPISVSRTERLTDALLLTGFPYDRRERPDHYLRYLRAFLTTARGIRRAGAASMDFVAIATGCADGFWEIGLSPWDVAAGALLVREAGGMVTGLDQEPLQLEGRQMFATNGQIHGEMGTVLSELITSK